MNGINKKVLIPMIIGIVLLLVILGSVTYAYFAVGTNNDFGTQTITAGAGEVGTVILRGPNASLRMDLSLPDMMGSNAGKTYYASSLGKTETPTEEVIGEATATGTGTYTCNYSMKIEDNSNSIYDKFQAMNGKSTEQIVLTVNGVDYDFDEANLFPKTINGTLSGISVDSPQTITAGLRLVNSSSVNQTALADSSITLTFSMESFECEIATSQ